MDLTVVAEGKSWEIPDEPFEGLKYKPLDLLGLLVRLALADVEHGGLGLEPEELREQFLSKLRWRTGLPATGTEHVTFARVFPELKRRL